MSDQRMSKKMMKALKDAVGKLSERYEFSRDEGEELLGLNEKKKKVGKPCVPLPWTGKVCSDWCKGVRPSHGLYSQCANAPIKEEEYCKTCKKKDDIPTVDNRNEWMSTNGKKAKHYWTFLKKKGISREEADREAAKFGLTIPESLYEDKGSSRGRPRKTAATSDTDESDDEPPKKRGRPRKASETPDMFAALVAENAAEENNERTEKEAEKAKLKAEKEAEKAKLKAEKEAEKAKLKAEKEADKAKLKAEKEAEKAKLTEIRKGEREERRNKKDAKKKVETDDTEKVSCSKKTMGDLFGETTDDEEDKQECKKDEEKKKGEDELREEEYGEEEYVKSWENNGVKYILNKKTGDVYDRKSQEHIGIWNGEVIEEVASSSDTDGEE